MHAGHDHGYGQGMMSDYSESGAQPVEDAATDDPPTVDEVRRAQERDHPEQARSALSGIATSDAALEREPADGQLPSDTDVQAERQAEGVEAEREAAGEDFPEG